jgi:hypothetical protein
MSTSLRIILALLLLGHGVAHLPGFLVAWRLREFPTLPYVTTALGGTLDVGTLGTRVIGGLWLVVGLTIVAAGLTLLVRTGRAPGFLWPALAASAILCVLGWPAARLGLVANLLIAALLFGTATMGGPSTDGPP